MRYIYFIQWTIQIDVVPSNCIYAGYEACTLHTPQAPLPTYTPQLHEDMYQIIGYIEENWKYGDMVLGGWLI